MLLLWYRLPCEEDLFLIAKVCVCQSGFGLILGNVLAVTSSTKSEFNGED